MKTRRPYNYSILRYVHDPSSGEFINVGVALHSEEDRFFDIEIRTTLGRISETFPDIKASALKYLLRSIQKSFSSLGEAYSAQSDFEERAKNLHELIYSVLPKDDSSLIWAPISSGISDDPKNTLSKLFQRYVTKYDHKKQWQRRTDLDVWREFKKDLEDRSLSNFFNTKVISTNVDNMEFPFAWKNGIWHCVEPISFDLSTPEYIREKAHRFLGQITSIHNSTEEFKLYLLIGKPSKSELGNAFEKALGILNSMPVKSEVFFEEEKGSLLNKLSHEIKQHESNIAQEIVMC
jgi:hypothetical protein